MTLEAVRRGAAGISDRAARRGGLRYGLGQKNSGPGMDGILHRHCRGAVTTEYTDHLGASPRFLLSKPSVFDGCCDIGSHLDPAGDDE